MNTLQCVTHRVDQLGLTKEQALIKDNKNTLDVVLPGFLVPVGLYVLFGPIHNCAFMMPLNKLSEQFSLWMLQGKAAETSQQSK